MALVPDHQEVYVMTRRNTPWLEPLPPRPTVIYDERSSTTVSTSRCRGRDPHIGPHNRCQHPTPAPAGYVRCAGEPGCAFRIPEARADDPYCPFHQGARWDQPAREMIAS